MALIDDPKVKALVEKEVAKATKEGEKAVKAETKRILELVKDGVPTEGDKAAIAIVKTYVKNLTAAIKAA